MKKVIILLSILTVLLLGCETDPPAGEETEAVEQGSFSAGADVFKDVLDADFKQAATGAEGTGTTTYSSSDESVATVDSATGEVDILAKGVTTITASNTGDTSFKAAEDSYELTVTDSRFVMTWDIADGEETDPVRITSIFGNIIDYDIDWGDGTIETDLDGDASHTYSSAGVYTVAISGALPHFSTGRAGDDRLYAVENWGDIEWEDMSNVFRNCASLVIKADDTPDLSNVTDVSSMFSGIDSIESVINNWDVSNIEIMSQMFSDTASFNKDISAWDVSNVTDMGYMFQGASSFNQDISGWNVSSAEIMDNMFQGAAAFSGHDLRTWDVRNVTQHDLFSDGWGTGNTEPNWP